MDQEVYVDDDLAKQNEEEPNYSDYVHDLPKSIKKTCFIEKNMFLSLSIDLWPLVTVWPFS